MNYEKEVRRGINDLDKHYSTQERIDNFGVKAAAYKEYNRICENQPHLEIAKDDFDVHFLIYDKCRRRSMLGYKEAGGSCLMKEKWCEGNEKLAIISINNNAYDTYGWDMYKMIVRHELAHAECNIRFGHSVFADGDRQFEEIVDELNGVRSRNHGVKYALQNDMIDYLEYTAEKNNTNIQDLATEAGAEEYWEEFQERHGKETQDYQNVTLKGNITVK